MSIKKIMRLPENDKTNGWSRLLAPRTPKPALAKDLQADWVIVGGGLAGDAFDQGVSDGLCKGWVQC